MKIILWKVTRVLSLGDSSWACALQCSVAVIVKRWVHLPMFCSLVSQRLVPGRWFPKRGLGAPMRSNSTNRSLRRKEKVKRTKKHANTHTHTH